MSTQLSVIIVNYNVKYFLEQALLSVQKASASLSVEIIVVDNNSVDGSVEMIQQKFSNVILIANQQNTGFSVANNQGIAIAKGKYVLLLNPDTVVEEDTFQQVIQFMEAHPDAGGLGVRMYDGRGVFLPESKRGLPNPMVAFYKMLGLGSLFPKSKRFNYYYLGHLDENEVQKVEVLSGAFMLLRKSVLDKIGGLDEMFFMYGEDIDMSYRIIQAGYKNYYYPHTRIIHYKGESTKKGSLNYVRMFYNAMIIFAKKHYAGNRARWYIWGIQAAIYFKAFLAIFQQFINRIFQPATDGFLIFGGLWFIKDFWQNNIKAAEHITYPSEYLLINVPLYISIWLISVFFSGGYDRPIRLQKTVRGLLFGTILIAAIYGFLPEHLRFSRAMIVLGMAWAVFALVGFRFLLQFVQHRTFKMAEQPLKRAVIVGNIEECKRVHTLLHQAAIRLDLIGYVLAETSMPFLAEENNLLGKINQLAEVINIYKIEEVIFCAKDLAAQQIIQFMIDTNKPSVDYKIVPPESLTIIGSNSKNTAGDLYTIDINLNLNKSNYQRNKRVLDIGLALLFLLLSPVLCLFLFQSIGLIKNSIKVLFGKQTWVGYVQTTENITVRLPKIREGILSPLDQLEQGKTYNPATMQRLNLLYAKDYTTEIDLLIVWKGFKKIGVDDIGNNPKNR